MNRTPRKPRAVRLTITMYFGSDWQKELHLAFVRVFAFCLQTRMRETHRKNDCILSEETL